MVKPHDGSICTLLPLTFGTYLPLKFRSIPEEGDGASLEIESPNSVHLQNFGTSRPNRKVQYFGVTFYTNPQVKKKFTENRKVGQGKALTYISPISKDGKIYQNWLIGYVIGDRPYLKSIENYVDKIWSCEIKPQILLHDTRRSSVGCWSSKSLSKIASGIGQPKHTDQLIASMEHILYASICVEVDVLQPLIESIEMITPTGNFHQPLTTVNPMQSMVERQMQAEPSTSRGANKFTPLLNLEIEGDTPRPDVNGRRWLLWRSTTPLQVVETNEQFIHCYVDNQSGSVKAYVIIVYAKNTATKKNSLWVLQLQTHGC
ncbi:hypothetical protein R3W88_029545 [Solanum pinnatisectum]|uniref:Uncharacterized protein n=1 Tax=Solanum pinnatisectum TaxID=50273 RepID=A0AAV9K7V0_9SOLN|nr:hypothetical protein R3W88_029545 [Solanum pinnatisectum]